MNIRDVCRVVGSIVAGLAIGSACTPATGGGIATDVSAASTNSSADVDIDLTRMSQTARFSCEYRLNANPSEFEGKTLRISGTLVTRMDKADGRRHFGCLINDGGGCTCCSTGFVLEFVPSDSEAWAISWPSIDSPITVSGRLEMVQVGDNALRQPVVTIPRLVDAQVTTSDATR